MKNLALELATQFRKLSKLNQILIAVAAVFTLLLSLLDALALTLLSSTLKGASSQSLMAHAPELLFVIFLFIVKSLLSALITYISMRHFEKIEFQIGEENVRRLRTSSWSDIRHLTAVDYANFIDKSPNAVATSLLFAGALFIAESITAGAITFVLLKESFFSSTVALLFFGVVVLIQNRYLGRISERVGQEFINGNNDVQLRTQEFARLGKLLKISPSLGFYDELNAFRRRMIRSRNTAWYLGSVPRYYMEAVLAAGLVIVAGSSFLADGSEGVFPALSLFAAAGYRLLPTINRMQGYAITAVSALPFIRIEEELFPTRVSPRMTAPKQKKISDEILIELKDVSFGFQDSPELVLKNVSLTISRGKTYAVLGPSGSGKTTLADITLGLLKPSRGTVLFNPALSIAYVPQDTSLIKGSLIENIILGEQLNVADLRDAVRNAELDQLQERFDEGEISQISGGQKQRIGLARALYRKASFTVFDEATSSLDNITESRIVENLQRAKSETGALLIIAHRLSTVRDADCLIYMDEGSILGVGTWSELLENCAPFRAAVALGEIDSDE